MDWVKDKWLEMVIGTIILTALIALTVYNIAYARTATTLNISVVSKTPETRSTVHTEHIGNTTYNRTEVYTVYAVETVSEVFDATPQIADQLPLQFQGVVEVRGWKNSGLGRRDITRVLTKGETSHDPTRL